MLFSQNVRRCSTGCDSTTICYTVCSKSLHWDMCGRIASYFSSLLNPMFFLQNLMPNLMPSHFSVCFDASHHIFQCVLGCFITFFGMFWVASSHFSENPFALVTPLFLHKKAPPTGRGGDASFYSHLTVCSGERQCCRRRQVVVFLSCGS